MAEGDSGACGGGTQIGLYSKTSSGTYGGASLYGLTSGGILPGHDVNLPNNPNPKAEDRGKNGRIEIYKV